MNTPPHGPGIDPVDAVTGVSGIRDDGVAGISGPDCSPAAVVDYLSGLDISTMDADTALTVVCLAEKLVGFGHAVQVRGLARLAALRPTCDPVRGFDQYAAAEPVRVRELVNCLTRHQYRVSGLM